MRSQPRINSGRTPVHSSRIVDALLAKHRILPCGHSLLAAVRPHP
nr:MAG TPA: hypothetical protein [Caudoviricetes sp.]